MLDRPYLHVYPDGSSIRIQYDARGMIAGYGKDAMVLQHDADGAESVRRFATGVEEWQRYDDDRRRTESLTRAPDGSIVQRLEWVLDPVANILEVRDKRPGVAKDKDRFEVYQLDNLYRLTKAAGPWGEATWKYSPSGNVVARLISLRASERRGAHVRRRRAPSRPRLHPRPHGEPRSPRPNARRW